VSERAHAFSGVRIRHGVQMSDQWKPTIRIVRSRAIQRRARDGFSATDHEHNDRMAIMTEPPSLLQVGQPAIPLRNQ